MSDGGWRKLRSSRRKWLGRLFAVGIGGGAVYAYLEGLPSSFNSDIIPIGDPLTTTFTFNSVFDKLRWHENGEIDIYFESGHDTIGFTISRENERVIEDSLYTGDSPAATGPVSVDMSGIVESDGRATYELAALGGDLEDLFIQPDVVTTETFEVPDNIVENF